MKQTASGRGASVDAGERTGGPVTRMLRRLAPSRARHPVLSAVTGGFRVILYGFLCWVTLHPAIDVDAARGTDLGAAVVRFRVVLFVVAAGFALATLLNVARVVISVRRLLGRGDETGT